MIGIPLLAFLSSMNNIFRVSMRYIIPIDDSFTLAAFGPFYA